MKSLTCVAQNVIERVEMKQGEKRLPSLMKKPYKPLIHCLLQSGQS